MAGLTKRERNAVAAVAAHFSAASHTGNDPHEARLVRKGKLIDLDIATIARHASFAEKNGKPRLRFDKVVLRLFRDLQTALAEVVPPDRVAIVTVTAPIRLPAKTAEALDALIRTALSRRATRVEIADTIHGNDVRVRIVKSRSGRPGRVIGFVHNPDPHAAVVLLDGAAALLQCMRDPAQTAAGCWLVIANENPFPPVETWQQICSQLAVSGQYGNIVMAFDGGRVASLTG